MYRDLGGMVRTLKLLVWTLALVGLWASTEQGAFTTPPGPVELQAAQTQPVVPDGVWAKLRALFSEASVETQIVTLRKGRQ
jgi:hypothetical protein